MCQTSLIETKMFNFYFHIDCGKSVKDIVQIFNYSLNYSLSGDLTLFCPHSLLIKAKVSHAG